MTFKEYQSQLAPTYIKLDYYKNAQEEIFGTVKDEVSDAARDAVLAGFVDTAPNDALDILGQNFNIDRCQMMSDDDFRMKLSKAWDYWQTSGTPARLIKEIKDLGLPNVYILPQYVEFPSGVFTKTLPVVDTNNSTTIWAPNSMEEQGNFWSNFWVIIDQPHGFNGRLWGSTEAGIWGVGYAGIHYKWGSVTGDQDLLACIVETIKKLKPAWTSCRGIVFLKTGAKVWGEPHWGDGTLWGLDPSKYVIYRLQEDWELDHLLVS